MSHFSILHGTLYWLIYKPVSFKNDSNKKVLLETSCGILSTSGAPWLQAYKLEHQLREIVSNQRHP
jgi:hypothetical protein